MPPPEQYEYKYIVVLHSRSSLHEVRQLDARRVEPQTAHEHTLVRRPRNAVPVVEPPITGESTGHVAQVPLAIVRSRVALAFEQLGERGLTRIEALGESRGDGLSTSRPDGVSPGHQC